MRYSVIIPVYNAAPYVEKCLDSIVAAVKNLALERQQEAGGVEIICVNDGSTDASEALLIRYQAKVADLPCVALRVVSQENAGVSVARNRGLELATGDFICFVDADDVVLGDWLTTYDEAFRQYRADVVRLAGEKPWPLDAYPWKYAIKRAVAGCARFPGGVAINEDSVYVLRLLPHVGNIVQLHRMTYRHLVRAESAMLRKLKSQERLAYLMVIREICKTLPAENKCFAAQLCAGGLLAWLLRPADYDYKREIWTEWRSLRRSGIVGLGDVSGLFRVPYLIYCLTGALWPARVWQVGVAWLVAKKKYFKGGGR